MHPFYGANSEFLSQGNYWIGLISMLLYLVFWTVALIIGVRFIKKYILGSVLFMKKGDTAMEILRERYARGEINGEEFKRIKSDLEEN
ncbi:MAG: SHOCT domain-containing protein [Solirubrobacterales bacterium]